MKKSIFLLQKSSFIFSVETIQKIYFGGFIVLILALSYYQIVKGDYYFKRAKNNYVRLIPLRAIRGSILDRNGKLIADDKASFNISVIPYQIKRKKDSLFREIAKFLNLDVKSLYRNYNKNLRSLFIPVDILIGSDKITALALKEKFADAILINTQPQRYYSYPYQFAHILGYVKKATARYEELKKYGYQPLERIGFSGIEQQYDAYLKGEDGGDSIEVDAKGKMVGFLGKQIPKKGKSIQLTIDSRIQNAAYQSLEGEKGAIILMNSDNGEIIALCSAPSFDLNHFVKGKNIAKLLNNKDSPMLNRAMQASYPIGSVFKPILALAALETGKSRLGKQKITSATTFFCNGELRLGLAKFRCWATHGRQNLHQALIHSCNIYFYNLGLLLGPNIMSKWAKKITLDSLTNIDLPYEKKGFIPTVKWKRKKLKIGWFPGDTFNLSIGQGFMTSTPLEVIIAINVFANNGYLVVPHILRKVAGLNSELATRTYLGASEMNIKKIKKGLRGAISEPGGTASMLRALNLQISGKTGTAQTGGESHGWFVGYFPYRNKKYTICVFLENVGSSYVALKVTYNFLEKITKDNDFL